MWGGRKGRKKARKRTLAARPGRAAEERERERERGEGEGGGAGRVRPFPSFVAVGTRAERRAQVDVGLGRGRGRATEAGGGARQADPETRPRRQRGWKSGRVRPAGRGGDFGAETGVISSWSVGCDARFFGAAGPGPGPGWVVGLWAFCGSGFAAGLDGARCVHQRVVFRDEGSGGPAARRNCQVICWPLAAAGGLGNARLHPSGWPAGQEGRR